jgi:hypothetical protein
MRVKITPSGFVSSINDTLAIESNAFPNIFSIPVTAKISLPPVLNIQDNTINVKANNKDYEGRGKVVIDNFMGSADLQYMLNLKFERAEAEASAVGKASIAMSPVSPVANAIKRSEINTSVETYSYTPPFSYSRMLEYDTASVPETSVGYGGTSEFQTATAFYAPANGFNLTHVLNYWVPGNWLNSRITVEILSGADDINNAVVLESQVVEHTIPGADDKGYYMTVELDRNIVFYPNEKFYVVFKYPLGLTYPQGMGKLVVPSENNRFLFGDGKGWYDLIGQGFDNLGWMVKAVEANFNSGTWVELISQSGGTIAPGDSAVIDLAFDATWSEPGTNTAKLEITTNDPLHRLGISTVNLILNQAPQFTSAPALSLYATEGIKMDYTIAASDPEADAFEYILESDIEYLTTTVTDGKFELSFFPDMDAQASYNFNVTATDTNGNSSGLPVTITVAATNRAPEFIGSSAQINLYLATGIEVIATKPLFSDPDGDYFTVFGTINDNSVAEIFNSEAGVALQPLKLGTTAINLTATDVFGAKVSTSIDVTVEEVSAIQNINDKGFVIFPNPAAANLNISKNTLGNAVIRIIDMGGQPVLIEKIEKSESIIDIKGLPQGIYTIELSNDKEVYRRIFVKQ